MDTRNNCVTALAFSIWACPIINIGIVGKYMRFLGFGGQNGRLLFAQYPDCGLPGQQWHYISCLLNLSPSQTPSFIVTINIYELIKKGSTNQFKLPSATSCIKEGIMETGNTFIWTRATMSPSVSLYIQVQCSNVKMHGVQV